MLVKVENLFWLRKKRNDIFLNANVSSHSFSWYDNALMYPSLLMHFTLQTQVGAFTAVVEVMAQSPY
jgi:hypothetical protein